MPRKYSKSKRSLKRNRSLKIQRRSLKPRKGSKLRTLKRKRNKRGGDGDKEFDLDFRYISPDVTFSDLQINRCIDLNEDQSRSKECVSGSFSKTFLAEQQSESVEFKKPNGKLGLVIDHLEGTNLYIQEVKAEAVKELKEVAKIGSKLVSINAKPIESFEDFVSKYSQIKQNSKFTLEFEQEYAMKIYKKEVEPSLSKTFDPLILNKSGQPLGLYINNDILTLEDFDFSVNPYKSNKYFYESYIGQRISSVNETPVKTIDEIRSKLKTILIGDNIKFEFFDSNRNEDFMYVEKGNNAHEKLQKLINREEDSELKDENFYIVKLWGHGIVREAASSSKKLSINQSVLDQNNVYDGALFSICEKGMSVDLFEFCLTPGAIYNINDEEPENKKKLIINILTQIAIALDFIHRNGFIHYDLKPENVILLNYVKNDPNSIRIRLIDFDYLVTTEQAKNEEPKQGTPGYKAPEVKGYMKYDHTAKLDIFSFGILILDLITIQKKKGPVYNMTNYIGIGPNYDFLNDEKKYLDTNLKRFINPKIDPEDKLFDLFKSCVKTDPDERPDASKILGILGELQKLTS